MAKHKLSYALPVAAMAMGAFAAMPTAVMADSTAVELTEDKTLTASVSECYTVKAGKTVTIDFKNFDITCENGSAITVEEGATATITGTGNVISKTNGAAVLNKGGNVTIKSGTYRADNWYTIKNMGTMIIDGGVIGGTEHKNNSSLVVNGWADGKGTSVNDKGYAHAENAIATLTINGGEFTHLNTTSTIKSDDYSKTIIKNGTFKSEQGYLVQATGDVVIDGGKFTGFAAMIVFNGDGSDIYPGKAEINNGEINAKYVATNSWDNATLKITGGTFSGLESIVKGSIEKFNGEGISGGDFNIVPDALVAEGCDYAKNEDGSVKVVDLAALDAEGYELDENHNIISKAKDSTVATPETGTMTVAGASAANASILAIATAAVMSVIAGIAAFIKRK